MARSRAHALVLLAFAFAFLPGCPRTDQSLVLIGGARVDAARIDGDPLALLPAAAIFTGVLDARAFYASELGAQAAQLVQQLVPLGAESRFVPQRDVTRVFGALYAMQGVDYCAVVQGNFDPVAIEQAANARVQNPAGLPLVATPYAGYSIYTVADQGFVVLTPRTILSGNQTGMRRALDRLRFGRLGHDLKPWMHELLADEKAAIAVVGNLGKQAVVDAAGAELPFLKGIRMVRALGNFQAPGMNLVGSVSYGDAASAAEGLAALGRLRELASLVSMFAAIGFGTSVPTLELQQQGNDVALATSADTNFMRIVLATLIQAFRPAAKTSSTWIGG
ncbi:MAG: hypothetical protein EXR75_09685 [Myxococcales bacterium]|nr:hypothetical protein [Myxococcales bacterium]